ELHGTGRCAGRRAAGGDHGRLEREQCGDAECAVRRSAGGWVVSSAPALPRPTDFSAPHSFVTYSSAAVSRSTSKSSAVPAASDAYAALTHASRCAIAGVTKPRSPHAPAQWSAPSKESCVAALVLSE